MTILVMGLGSIGRRHIRNLISLGNKDIIAVDTDKSRRESMAREFDLKFYSKPDLAFKNERPTATLICTPTHLHVPHASLALDNDSHIFIEKPVSHNVKSVDSLIKKARRKRKVVMVACNYRFNDAWRSLNSNVNSRRYGRAIISRIALGYNLAHARKNRNYKLTYAAGGVGGGVILDSGCHVVDYLTPLFGVVKKTISLRSASKSLGIRSEEAAHIILEYKSGVTASISLDYVSNKRIHRVEIVTDKGLFTLDFNQDCLIFETRTGRKILYQGAQDDDQMFIDELRHFFRCIRNKRKPLQGLKDARDVLEVLLSAKNKFQ